MKNLDQSSEFKFFSLTFKRKTVSHTQCCISAHDHEGNLLFTLDGSAPYNPSALAHCQRDGRQNPFQVTDVEFKQQFLHSLRSRKLKIFNPDIYHHILDEVRIALKNGWAGKPD